MLPRLVLLERCVDVGDPSVPKSFVLDYLYDGVEPPADVVPLSLSLSCLWSR